MQSHLAPSVTPRPVKTGRQPGVASPASRAGRTYTPSASPLKSPQRSGSNPFSFAAAAAVAGNSSGSAKSDDSVRPAETAASPLSPSLRKKQLILSGDIRNLDSNFALAMSTVRVTLAHVIATLARFGIAVSPDDAQTLLYEYEENNDTALSYDAFVDDVVQMLRQTALNKSGTNRTAIKKVRLPHHLELLGAMHARHVRELQLLLRERLRVPWDAVRDAFRRVDPDRKGVVPKRVFADVCRALEIAVPAAVLEGFVLHAAESRADGVVDYTEFLACFGAAFQHNDPNSVSTSLTFERSVVDGNQPVFGIDVNDTAAGVNHTLHSPGVSSALGWRLTKPSSATLATSPIRSRTAPPDPLTLEQLQIVVSDKLAARYADVKRAFKALDRDSTGQLSATAFTHVLQDYNVVGSASELDALLGVLDTTGDGAIDYHAFLARFVDKRKPNVRALPQEPPAENSSLVFTGHSSHTDNHTNRSGLSSPGNALKDALSRMSDADWRAAFVELEMSDPRKTGLVTSAELVRVFTKYLGSSLLTTHYAALFRICGAHTNEFMSYRTLVKSYRPRVLDAVAFFERDGHARTDKLYRTAPTESRVMVWSIRVQRAQLSTAQWQALKDAIWAADVRRTGRLRAVTFAAIVQPRLALSADHVAFLCYFYADATVANDDVLIRYSSFLIDYEDPGLEDADAVATVRSKASGPASAVIGGNDTSRPRSLYATAAASSSSPVAFTDADRMEREMEAKRLRDFFAANVRALETLLAAEDPDKRGVVSLATLTIVCKALNGKWKDSSATAAFFSKYVTRSELFYYRGFLLDVDQKAGLQTQTLIVQDDDDDDIDDGDNGDAEGESFDMNASGMDVHQAKDALRQQLTASVRKQRHVYKLFQRLDPGKTGRLAPPELRRALERLGIDVDAPTARALCLQFEDEDVDGNRLASRIKYLELLHAHGGRDSDALLDGTSDVSSHCSYYSAISISPRPAVRHHASPTRPLASRRDHVAAATAVANAIAKPRNADAGLMTSGGAAAAAATVERKIKLQLEAIGKNAWRHVARALQHVDTERRGSVSATSFRKVMATVGVQLEPEDVARLELKYDVEQNGRIHYVEYLRHLTHTMSDLSGSGSSSPAELLPTLTSSGNSIGSAAGIPNALRQGVRAKWKAIYSSFRTLDKPNVGRVSPVHFRELLAWYELPVADDALLALLRQFDHDDDGGVDYSAFMRACVGG